MRRGIFILLVVLAPGFAPGAAPLAAQIVQESFARDPGPLDFIRGEGFEQAIMQALAGDALVGLDAQNRVVPRLADRWVSKGTTTRFHLREGLRFSSGAPVGSEDVAWTFHEIQRGTGASPTKKGLLEGVRIRAAGAMVEVSSTKPALRLLMELARVPIARSGHPEEGSGPFSFQRQGTEWTFTARPHFLHPKLPALHFRLLADEQALLQNLQKGWLSIGVPPARRNLRPPVNLVELRQPTHAQLLVWSRLGVAPLQALERYRNEALPADLFGVKAHPSRGLWPESLGFPPMAIQAPAPPPPRGQHWELLYSSGDELVQKTLLALRERALKDGVELEPKPVEAALLYERLQKGDFQLACAINIFDPHPWSVLELMEPAGPLNFCGWQDTLYPGLAQRLEAPASPAWRELQQVWSRHPAAIPILDFTSVVWVDRNLTVAPGVLGLYLSTPGPAGWTWAP